MIDNQAGFTGEARRCADGMWRIRYVAGIGGKAAYYPIEPDGFETIAECERWWSLTGQPTVCKVCGHVFFVSRDDGEFCRPACRAKYNRRQQGASERAGTGAYWQRPEDNRTHKRRADTFTYECEWCHRVCTARAEAQRSGKRAPKYCNDNGGKCRQAAYRAARSAKKGSSRGSGRPTGDSAKRPPYGGRDDGTRGGEKADPNTTRTAPPRHTGGWHTTREASAWMVEAMCYVKKIPRNAWAQAGDYRELTRWARTYIAEHHPDKTGKPADTFYKTISDCYSFLRRQR